MLSGTTLDPISALQCDLQHRVKVRAAFCEAFLELERKGTIRRTYGSIEANVDAIEKRAKAFLRDHVRTDQDASKRRAFNQKAIEYEAPHPRTLFRWVAKYEREGLSGLVDRWEQSGNHTSKFSAEVMGPLMEEVRRYASPQRPTKKAIFENVRNRFRAENQQRKADDLDPLPVPSREAVRRAIGKLDPFHLDIARLGLQAARRRHRPVQTGVEVTRPLERVEIDEYEIDLFTLLSSIGLLDLIDDEDKMRMGLDGSTQRWWVSAALCAASRCIVGLRLTRTPGSASSIETLHMCTLDKGQWADGVHANVWLAAARRLRAAKKAGQTASDEIVLKAIRDIEALDATARARVNLVAEDWSSERLEREENNLLVGFDVGSETTPEPPAQSGDELGIPLETAADKAARANAGANAGANPGAPTGTRAPDAAEATPQHRAKRTPGSGFRMED
ncbi:MAG: hypothetical protein V2J02_22025 [Pseudomonadales bacterium]|nr:hypothetical protein [Pseudomonadales bacterium]